MGLPAPPTPPPAGVNLPQGRIRARGRATGPADFPPCRLRTPRPWPKARGGRACAGLAPGTVQFSTLLKSLSPGLVAPAIQWRPRRPAGDAIGLAVSLALGAGLAGRLDGGAKEDRTPDLLRARQALSQLSYGPVVRVVGLGGLEPPTSPLSGVRSNQLSYRPLSTGGRDGGGAAVWPPRPRPAGQGNGGGRERPALL